MSSFNHSEFSPSELEALRVWKLPDIANKNASEEIAETNNAEPKPKQLTVIEIEAMQQQAYDEAFAQGKADGFEQGHAQGYDEGSKKGYVENVELLNNKAAQFTQLMEALTEPFKTLDEEVEQELVKLTIGIASQIIRREIKMDAGQVVAAVREAIKVLPSSSQKISLYLHPEDAELVRSALSLDEMTTAWAVIEDPLITRGGCKVDTEVSNVNATVESRLAAVVATVFGSERGRDRNL